MYRRAGGRERDQWSLTGYREHFIAHVAMLNPGPTYSLIRFNYLHTLQSLLQPSECYQAKF